MLEFPQIAFPMCNLRKLKFFVIVLGYILLYNWSIAYFDRDLFVKLEEMPHARAVVVRNISLAFGMFVEKVKAEKINTFEEYDNKFSIHYFCEE